MRSHLPKLTSSEPSKAQACTAQSVDAFRLNGNRKQRNMQDMQVRTDLYPFLRRISSAQSAELQPLPAEKVNGGKLHCLAEAHDMHWRRRPGIWELHRSNVCSMACGSTMSKNV